MAIEQKERGSVTFVQRFGPSANLHLHFHCSLYGIYAPRKDETPEFFSLRPPENSEVAALAGVVAEHQTCRPCSKNFHLRAYRFH